MKEKEPYYYVQPCAAHRFIQVAMAIGSDRESSDNEGSSEQHFTACEIVFKKAKSEILRELKNEKKEE